MSGQVKSMCWLAHSAAVLIHPLFVIRVLRVPRPIPLLQLRLCWRWCHLIIVQLFFLKIHLFFFKLVFFLIVDYVDT